MKSPIKPGFFSHDNALRNRKTPTLHIQSSQTTTAEFKAIKALDEIPDELKKLIMAYLDDKTLLTSLPCVNKAFYNLLDNVSIADRMAGYNAIQKAKLTAFIKKVITEHVIDTYRKNFIESYHDRQRAYMTIAALIYKNIDQQLAHALLSQLPFKLGKKFLLAYEQYQGLTDKDVLAQACGDLHTLLKHCDGPGIAYICKRERSLPKTFIATNSVVKTLLRRPKIALGLSVGIFLMAIALLKIYDGTTNGEAFTILKSIAASLTLATVLYGMAFAVIYKTSDLALSWRTVESFRHELLIQIESVAKDPITEKLIKELETGQMQALTNKPAIRSYS